MIPFLYLAIGILTGLAIGWLAARAKGAAAIARLGDLQQRLEHAEAAAAGKAKAEAENRAASATLADLQLRLSRAETTAAEKAAADAGKAAAEAHSMRHQARVTEIAAELIAQKMELSKAVQAAAEHQRRATQIETQLKAQTSSHEAQLQEVTRARDEMTSRFREIAADALKTNNEQFLLQAASRLEDFQKSSTSDLALRQEAIGQMLNPLQQRLREMGERVDAVEKARSEAYGQLGEQLRGLMDAQQTLSTETTRLSTALRSASTRGVWGEIQLKRLLEASGLIEGQDFFLQASSTREDGTRARPDAVVRLPGGRSIAVDAKVPLTDFLSGTQCVDEAEQRKHFAEHGRKVQGHAKALGQRSYWEDLDGSPVLVVMFMPADALLTEALANIPALIDECHRQNVVIATPGTLLAMLKAVAQGWQQERLSKEVGEIQKLGGELYDRIGVLAEHLTDVGKALTTATTAYNKVVGSVERRLLVTAGQLRDKGVQGSREVPETLSLVPQDVRDFSKPELLALQDPRLNPEAPPPLP